MGGVATNPGAALDAIASGCGCGNDTKKQRFGCADIRPCCGLNGPEDDSGIAAAPVAYPVTELSGPDGDCKFGSLAVCEEGSYTGQLSHGVYEGFGVLRSSRSTYDGEWLRGIRHGHGKENWVDGRNYEGQFSNGKFEGAGSMTWLRKRAANDGRGQVWADDRSFEGQFHDGKFAGIGTMTWLTGNGKMICKGQYDNDQKHGIGSFSWPDGRVYHGAWREGQRSGEGTYTTAEGVSKGGIWAKDKFVRWVDEHAM